MPNWIPYREPYAHLGFVVRAGVPSRRYNFSNQRLTRSKVDTLIFAVEIPDRTNWVFDTTVYFEFDRKDWQFTWEGPYQFTAAGIVNRLIFQFEELQYSHSSVEF